MPWSIARVAVVLCAPAVIACGACSYGLHMITRSHVAEQITDRMTDAAGNKPESVSCPDDLQPTVGASVTCTMMRGGKPFRVKVTVTAIEGDSAKFDMEIVPS